MWWDVTVFPFGETVVRIRQSTRDRLGDYADVPSEVPISNVGIDWNTTTENNNFRETTESDVTLIVPKGADIEASDRVRLPDGSEWRVIGRPMWSGVHPITGWDPGVMQVRIREA